MSLNDPSLLTSLKAQIHIGGTPQVNTFQATFHYQMAYRVQNHSLDILVPGQDNARDALLIDVDSNATPTCTYVPRQLSPDELVKLLLEKWITNYEQIHQAPVRSTSAPEFVRHENGLVEIKFSSSQSKSDNSENVVAQNKFLVKILSQQSMITNSQEYLSSRVRSLKSIINELRFKIQELHREIIQIIRTSPTTQHFSFISQKEAEMKNLKNQLQDLERQHKQKRITSLIDDPWRLPSTPFVGVSFDPQPLPQSYTHTTSPLLNIWTSEQRRLKPSARKEPTLLQESQSIADVVTSTKTPDVLPIQKVNPVSMFLNSLTQTDKPQTSQFIALVIKPQMDYEEIDNAESFEHLFMAEPENAESTVQFDAEEYEEHQENPNQETPTEFSKSDIKQYFTFDDVPPSKWRERSIEMLTCKKWKSIRKKKQRGRTSDMCFICQKRESLYSLNDEPSNSVLCTITYSDLSSDDDSDTDSPESDSDFEVHMINPIPHVLPIQEDPPLPLAKIYLLADAYAKPIPVIAFFDIDEQSHAELLSKFYSLVTKYGIILSEKKMEVGVTTIQFLGMEIFDGKYQPQPHVAQELLKFPDELSSQKMIQQFLGLVNYMADFLPKLSHHTAWLFPMLKNNPPKWTSRQTEAVKAVKSPAEKMPPLKIHASSEKRILQTDASDECWGAVLLVQDNNNKRHVCGYKSGTFKASKKYYHSTFKEILAVKRGIEKF
uniref:Putative zinc finger, CCHC-type n=1 Tax=Tanacetum cinerariifolium TaxID=118510 RepID=A0A6L2J404_TANCI|nr:putative zinc finger, CCHC-type [Tanacetum cinerariifolium]